MNPMAGMAPYGLSMPGRGQNQMYFNQCAAPQDMMPPNSMPRLGRGIPGPCFPDDKINCGMMGVGEFKPPSMMPTIDPTPPLKKKRRTANSITAAAAVNPPPHSTTSLQDLLPPPLSGYGDTIVASNPFDDSPPQMSPHVSMNNINSMNHHMPPQHLRHMPCSPQHLMHMGGPSPCQMGGSPLNCGPPIGSPMSGPMSCGQGGPMSCGPGMGSPIGPNRSPLMCPPHQGSGGMINCGPPSGSPMNNPSSVGSPLQMNQLSHQTGPPSGSPLECGGVNNMGNSNKGSPMGNGNPQQHPSPSLGGAVPNGGIMPGMNCGNSPLPGSPMPGGGCHMVELGGNVLNRSPAAAATGGSPLCRGGPSPHHLNNIVNNVNSSSAPNTSASCPPLNNSDCAGPKNVNSHPISSAGNVSSGVSTCTVSCGVNSNNSFTNVTSMNGPSNNRQMQSMQGQQPSPMQQQNQLSQQASQPVPHPASQSLQHQQQMMNHHPHQPPNMMVSGSNMHPHPMGMHANYSGPKQMPVSAGKIYPADQPMVFNPQNPNAPPIYPCGICHKEVNENDQALLCESGCNFWFHRPCTGMVESAFHLLVSEVYAEWVCDKCLATKNIPLVKMKP